MSYPTKENHTINRYNGHTWIVASIGMCVIGFVTLAGFGLLGGAMYLTSLSGNEAEMGEVTEAIVGVPSIMFGCYKSITGLFAHLTTPSK